MRKLLSTALALCLVSAAFAQTDSTITPKARMTTRASKTDGGGDHFMIHIGPTSWTNKPHSINTSGFPRSLNVYLMMDFPFKTNTHWSVGLGPGISTDNIFFEKTYIGLKDNTPTLRFDDVSDTNHFKKYKLATAYLELPVELRYRFNASNPNGGVKLALGARVGTLLSSKVKGKTLQNRAGNDIGDYTSKEKSNRFVNKNRLSVMGRVGIGHFSVFATYSITPVFREGLGPDVRPLTIGLAISGL